MNAINDYGKFTAISMKKAKCFKDSSRELFVHRNFNPPGSSHIDGNAASLCHCCAKLVDFLQNPELRFNKARFGKILSYTHTDSIMLGIFLFVITAPMLCLSCKKDHNATPFPEAGFCRARLLLGFCSKMHKNAAKNIKDHQGKCCVGNRTNDESLQVLICQNENHLYIWVNSSLVAHVGLSCHLLPARFQSATFSMSRCLLI